MSAFLLFIFITVELFSWSPAFFSLAPSSLSSHSLRSYSVPSLLFVVYFLLPIKFFSPSPTFSSASPLHLFLVLFYSSSRPLQTKIQDVTRANKTCKAHALSARIPPHCIEFPFLVLLLSGGHSQILLCKGVGQYHQLGGTSDDSLGEWCGLFFNPHLTLFRLCRFAITFVFFLIVHLSYDKVFRILAESAAPSLDNFSRKIHAGQALEELAR